ncbi:hypothetical protein NUW54_g6600 [Trametes sanguinea]|uniref:Uncharacterized protein n=1 Tax=Trametes sanguinea TaxID=158606 RepID=A0ACC1PTM6_9APHY|nr:hypothetical protein NUW54_g6600 [Trametes sanguinea]
MSSSHSSARPTPKWRSSLSNKRHLPATSVSLVFAQPEQGAKLASAIDKLPATVLDDAASFMSQASRKRERTQSEASSFVSRIDQHEEQSVGGQVVLQQAEDVSRKRSKLSLDVHADTSHAIDQATQGQTADSPDPSANPVAVTDSPQVAAAPQESPTTKEEPKLDAGAKTDDSSSSLLPKINIPFPGSEPQKTIRAAKPSSTRSSWFGFSRAKPDESSSSAIEPPDNSTGEHVTDSPQSHLAQDACDRDAATGHTSQRGGKVFGADVIHSRTVLPSQSSFEQQRNLHIIGGRRGPETTVHKPPQHRAHNQSPGNRRITGREGRGQEAFHHVSEPNRKPLHSQASFAGEAEDPVGACGRRRAGRRYQGTVEAHGARGSPERSSEWYVLTSIYEALSDLLIHRYEFRGSQPGRQHRGR